jgi:hypothetical protein
MRIVILQPSYLPWRGYFHQLFRSDVFVFYDDVQYDKNGWRNRNRIRTSIGWQWITVPILTKGRFGQAINEVRINNSERWREKHWRAIQQAYQRAPFFQEYAPFFKHVYTREREMLADLDIHLTIEIAKLLGVQRTRFVRSSDLGIKGDRVGRILNICKHFGAKEYLVGPSAQAYMMDELFTREGIRVEYQQYDYPSYPQVYQPFVPQLSIIDLLFNCGPHAGHYIWGQ